MTGTTWKPDPEGMNGSRAEWAGAAVRHFMASTGTDWSDAVADLLGDLMHFCDREDDFDFDCQLDRARMHYEAETSGTVTILVEALNTIANGNTDPDRMVAIAGDALESFCPARGRTKIDTAGIPFDNEATAAAKRKSIKRELLRLLRQLIALCDGHEIGIDHLMTEAMHRP